MSQIEGSVGQGGANLERDVRIVQELLNRQELAPLARINEDGRCGSSTIEAIRHFQVRYLGMNSPDGRVDPDGRTIRRLSSGTTERGTGENPETRRADRDARASLVSPHVKETAVTTRIIDDLLPRLANLPRARIISGYMSDSDQFWKVNYHWEYLFGMVEHSLTLPLEEADRGDLENIRSALAGCKPDPSTGYTSSPYGIPQDRSSAEDAANRYRVLSSMKQSFKRITDRARLKEKSGQGAHVHKTSEAFDLAAAPVAPPGTSIHGRGYAVDIEGANSAIASLCHSLGATLVFDEGSHVHVEFKNGVAR